MASRRARTAAGDAGDRLAQRPLVGIGGFMLDAFRQGLKGGGYIEGRNLAVEYRWADGQYERLPALAADLVRRPIAALVSVGGNFVVPIATRSTLEPGNLVASKPRRQKASSPEAHPADRRRSTAGAR